MTRAEIEAMEAEESREWWTRVCTQEAHVTQTFIMTATEFKKWLKLYSHFELTWKGHGTL